MACARTVAHPAEIVERFAPYGQSVTRIVLDTQLDSLGGTPRVTRLGQQGR
jgi:hypothetical protein